MTEKCAISVSAADPGGSSGANSNSADLGGAGLDSASDTNDDPNTGGASSDQDRDGFLNHWDNCPLISNVQDTANPNDKDHDQIGDVCDTTPGTVDGDDTTADGPQFPLATASEVSIGSGAGPNAPPRRRAAPTRLVFKRTRNVCRFEKWEPGSQPTDAGDTTPRRRRLPTARVVALTTTVGLSAGAVIGTVAAVAAIVAVVGADIYFICRRGQPTP